MDNLYVHNVRILVCGMADLPPSTGVLATISYEQDARVTVAGTRIAPIYDRAVTETEVTVRKRVPNAGNVSAVYKHAAYRRSKGENGGFTESQAG